MKRPTHTAIVWWYDAWEGEPEIKHDRRGYLRVSIGFLLQDDKHGVSIADTYDAPDKEVECRTFIPRGSITRMLRAKVRWQQGGR